MILDHKVKTKLGFRESNLEVNFDYMTLDHKKQPPFCTESNVVRMGL